MKVLLIELHDGFNAEVFKDKKRQWRWRVRGANGEIVAQSEGYKNKQDATDILDRLFPPEEEQVAFVAEADGPEF